MTTMTSLTTTPFHDAYLAQLPWGKKSTSGLLQRTSPCQGLAGETPGLARQEAQVALTELARSWKIPGSWKTHPLPAESHAARA